MPAAETDVDADDGEHVLLDLTGASNVFLSGSVTDDGGLSAGELRLKYLRPSDNTWRFIDGSAGPALPVSTAGLTIGAPAIPESDAQGLRWCKVVTVGGDGSSSPIVGHLALHGGVVSSSVLGDWAQLISDLGGDAEVPFFYDFRFNVTTSSGGTKADSIADVRGAGFGPSLGAGSDPDYNAAIGYASFDGSEAMVCSPTTTKADLSQPLTLIYVGTVRSTGAGKKWVAGVGDGLGQELGVRAGSGVISGQARAAATDTTIDSAVPLDDGAVRVCIVTQDGATGLSFEVPDDAADTAALAAAQTATSCYIALMETVNADAANRGEGDCYAFIGVKHVLSATEVQRVLAWALVFRNAATP
jgi:hypothetical protein